jgi:hypothetical protein
MNSSNLIQALTTNGTESPLMMRRLRPAMCNGIFNQKWCNARAWRDDIGDTFLVNNKVAHCKEERKIFYYMYEGISVAMMKKKKNIGDSV